MTASRSLASEIQTPEFTTLLVQKFIASFLLSLFILG
jgi:hypothetical protein